jgi:hypothetical protein
MPIQKVEFEFPDPDKVDKEIEVDIAENVTNITAKPERPDFSKANKAEADDIQVEITDDTPVKDRNRKPSAPPEEVTDDELSEYSDKVQKRIKQFTKGYHDERRKAEAAQREREEAVRLAQKLIEENNQLKESVNKNQELLLEQAKAKTKAEFEAAQASAKRAHEEGDSEKVAAAQAALATAAARMERVANIKPPALQQQENTVKTQPSAPEATVDDRALKWQQDNQWFGQDDEMTSLALGLHQRLVKEGVDPRSDEYYDRINRRMRQLFPDKFDEDFEEEDPKPAAKPRRSNVVAPASRSTAPRKVVLTASAVALAKRLGLTPEQYARQVAEDMRKQNG